MFHDLKCWPDYFQAVWDGRKRFELRKDDRPFKTGDTLRLREYEPVSQSYTGRVLSADITYILRPDLDSPVHVPRGHVLMSLASPVSKQR